MVNLSYAFCPQKTSDKIFRLAAKIFRLTAKKFWLGAEIFWLPDEIFRLPDEKICLVFSKWCWSKPIGQREWGRAVIGWFMTPDVTGFVCCRCWKDFKVAKNFSAFPPLLIHVLIAVLFDWYLHIHLSLAFANPFPISILSFLCMSCGGVFFWPPTIPVRHRCPSSTLHGARGLWSSCPILKTGGILKVRCNWLISD